MGMLENIAHRRMTNPTQHAEVLDDIDKFRESLRDAGHQTKKTAVDVMTKGILKPFMSTFKASLGMKKASMEKALGDTVGGMGTVALDGTKLIFYIAKTTGRFAKVATRLAIKK